MQKLNPPHIENILPPFVIDDTEGTLNVPFSLPRTVGLIDVKTSADNYKMRCIIRNVFNNTIVADEVGSLAFNTSDNSIGNAYFNITMLDKFISGQYYKVQVALQNFNGEDGYFSSVGITKCIKKPSIVIEDLKKDSILNKPTYKYTGRCTLNEPTEKVATYKFTLLDNDNNIIFTTGEQVHDNSKDLDNMTSIDSCYLSQSLDFNKEYTMNYEINTINGYSETCSVQIKAPDSVNLNLGNNLLVAEPDYENGTIVIKLIKKDINKDFTPLSYNFILLRASSEDNYATWVRLTDFDEETGDSIFQLENALLVGDSAILWEDFTVEHNVSYKYALQAYNSFGIFSNRIESNLTIKETTDGEPVYDDNGKIQYISTPTTIYFEDMYLSDGHKQLRIRFNPKVSSFKKTVLEQKTDTIGNKYPFFFRNGIVEYKEFPLSGLISLLMDPDDKFQSGLYYQKNDTRKITSGILEDTDRNNLTNLTNRNIYNEKKFKMLVLDWLTNGEPKIFRSPTEGNYIVRLMNTSLTPNDTLGRMLHTFNCTAYEIADYTFENLDKYGFINFNVPQYKYGSFIGTQTMKLSEFVDKQKYTRRGPTLNIPGAFFATITESYPINAKYNLTFEKLTNPIQVLIGNSGIYNVPYCGEENKLTSISWANWEELVKKYKTQGIDATFTITYGYYDLMNLTNFHFIENIISSTRIAQHIGKLNFSDENNISINDNGTISFANDEDSLSTLAVWGVREMSAPRWIKIKRRPIIPLYGEINDAYWNEAKTEPWSISSPQFLEQAIYRFSGENGYEYYDYHLNQKLDTTDMFKCSYNGNVVDLSAVNPSSIEGWIARDIDYDENINGASEGTYFEIDTTLLINTPIEELILGDGLMLEICYVAKEFVYNFNKGDIKDGWIHETANKLQINSAKWTQFTVAANKLDQLKLKMQIAYEEWINVLGQNSNQTTYLDAKEKYNRAWKNYVKNLRTVIYYITMNEGVTVT